MDRSFQDFGDVCGWRGQVRASCRCEGEVQLLTMNKSKTFLSSDYYRGLRSFESNRASIMAIRKFKISIGLYMTLF